VLGQGHDEDPGPSRQGGTELSNEESTSIPAFEHDITNLASQVEELSSENATLREDLDALKSRFDGLEQIAQHVEPWVGPTGQLTVRLERSEQAILALISDPHNPISSALQASRILTSIPTPSA
jgi:predicted RNase H-like nuclease (RuvC/YqgF family)